MPSKTSIDPEEPSLGRVRVDAIVPPHTPTSIKQCISRVEGTSFASANLFADLSCDIPLSDSHVSLLRNDGPGLGPDKPMALVQTSEEDELSIAFGVRRPEQYPRLGRLYVDHDDY